ncbi:MAG: phage portal protein [Ruminococcus sp.]|nr:phage portal protein [Ruminococcus sp.]
MEKRSLFSRVFGSKQNTTAPPTATQMYFLNGYRSQFTNYDGKFYDDTDIRACVDAIARNGAKLNPKHIRKNDKGFESVYGNLQRLLSKRPNELQNAYKFYYQIISELELYNNSIIYILKDENLKILGLYPIHYQTVKFYEYKNDIYLEFSFGGGQKRFVALKDCIHLTRFVGEDGVMGGNNQPIIKTLSFKHVLDEGISNAIKTTQSIKGVIKSTKAMLKPEDVKKMRDQFVADFIENADESGIGGLDATTDFTPVKIEPKTADDNQIKHIDNKLLSYYGVSEAIVQSKYSEDEWNAFYESILEPIGLQMSLEFSNKLFTTTEQFHGNEIVFTSNRLQYASNNTKINLIRYANNLMMIDELREVLNLEPLPDGQGQKVMQDLNHINSNIADKYQTGDDLNNEGDEENEE